jgi:hypothetical protein
VSGQLHAPAALSPRERAPRYALDRRLGRPSAGLDDMQKRKFVTLPGLQLRPLGRPVRSQSLYRQRYRGSNESRTIIIIIIIIIIINDLLWIYSPSVGPWQLFQFINPFILYIVGRTTWMGDQPASRPLLTHRTTQTQNKHGRHHCLEWDSNLRPSV